MPDADNVGTVISGYPHNYVSRYPRVGKQVGQRMDFLAVVMDVCTFHSLLRRGLVRGGGGDFVGEKEGGRERETERERENLHTLGKIPAIFFVPPPPLVVGLSTSLLVRGPLACIVFVPACMCTACLFACLPACLPLCCEYSTNHVRIALGPYISTNLSRVHQERKRETHKV